MKLRDNGWRNSALGALVADWYIFRPMTSAAIRVLVVDDFSPFRQWVCSKLESQGEFHLHEAADPREAICKSLELKPDLILLDIGLPHMSGIETQTEISRFVPSAKILFLSAFSDTDVVNSALSNGAKGYVLKSDAGRELLPAVEAVLRGGRFVSSRLEHIPRESLQVLSLR